MLAKEKLNQIESSLTGVPLPDIQPVVAAPKQKRKAQSLDESSKENRVYVPRARSGAYALLITLYRYKHGIVFVLCVYLLSIDKGRPEMLKDDLMRAAGPLSDTSFVTSVC